jgi:hypothetical protein
MRKRCSRSLLLPGFIVAIAWLAPATGDAQTWNPPRTPDGQPDIQGVWQGGPGNAGHSLEEGCCEVEHNRMQNRNPNNIGLPYQVIVEPKDGKVPFQPWAAEKRREHLVNMETPTELQHIEPEDRCSLGGVPRSQLRGPMKIQQVPGHVVIQYEWIHAFRVIRLDASPHPPKELTLWQGDSRGRWEGNTLVVDVTNFRYDPVGYNKQPWLDSHGTFYTDALHVVERWTFADANTIHYEATIEDPKVFTQPWKVAFRIPRHTDKDFELIEEACWEGVSVKHRIDIGKMNVKAGKTSIHSHGEVK